MKRKVLLKASTFQKVENTRGTDIKGALNLNKEVLDTLVDKDLIATNNCCNYYLSPVFFETDEDLQNALSEGLLPEGTIYIITDGQNTLEFGFIRAEFGELSSNSLWD